MSWIARIGAIAAIELLAVVPSPPRLAPAQDAKPEKPKAGGAKAGNADDAKPADEEPGLDLKAGGDAMKRYFLFDRGADGKPRKAGKEGFGLLVVLPGGDGGPDFRGFVANVCASCCPDDFLAAELVAPKWVDKPNVIWPMKPGDQPGMKFTTDEQVAATLADLAKAQKRKVDPKRTYVLAWSSGGPPSYSMALAEKPPFAAAYLAMSVFHDKDLVLSRAKGRAFFLDHSPDDATCPFADAQRAKESLTKAGAQVELVTYAGGHGWKDNPMARLKKGLAWMEEHRAGGPR